MWPVKQSGLRPPRTTLAALIASALCGALLTCRPPPPEVSDSSVRLVVLVVVDQMPAEFLTRFDTELTGGLRLLLDRGTVFTQAEHAHAVTHTASGHATISTGRYPRHHGIISNYWYESASDEWIYSAEDDGEITGPARLLSPTLGDWLKAVDRRSKVFAASGKDRAAVLLGGHRADGAYWFDHEDGEMESSEYYRKRDWLEDFNSRRWLERSFGDAWEGALASELWPSLELEVIDLGPRISGFPHALGGTGLAPDEVFFGAVYRSPRIDSHLARFAKHVLAQEELGADAHVDLLALSFSALDMVGHQFGPNSPEVADAVLNLDRALGELLAAVDRQVGLDHVVVALTADHGVVPVPEYRRRHELSGERIGSRHVLCLQRLERQLVESYGPGPWLEPGPFLATAAVERSGKTPLDIEAAAASYLAECPAVERVWTRGELTGDAPDERFGRLFFNNFHPQRSPDLQIQWSEYFMPSLYATTTHGSAYPYDTAVPLVVLAPGGTAGRVDAAVETADLAPTLAVLAGFDAPTEVDGEDLTPLIRRP